MVFEGFPPSFGGFSWFPALPGPPGASRGALGGSIPALPGALGLAAGPLPGRPGQLPSRGGGSRQGAFQPGAGRGLQPLGALPSY